jgi:hypothetical protein
VSRSNVGGEQEFLFVPYSVFTVVKVEWSDNPTGANPHHVFVEAALDNSVESEELPLAPWS